MMKPLLVLVVSGLLGGRICAAEATPEARYLEFFTGVNDAEHLEAAGDYAGAEKKYADDYAKLEQLRTDYPYFEEALVLHRLEDCRARLLALNAKTGGTSPAPPPLPPRPAPHPPYPWKEKIAATVFWIGEDSSKASAWAEQWEEENGGPDSPDGRNGYAAGRHASRLNPFYVALPFNDRAHPELAAKWVPAGWQRASKNGTKLSACKDRWIEIKNSNGYACYAQWEDVGPNGNDLAAYVFGSEVPGKAGIDVSPAVAAYLQLGGDAPKTVSWRFVDAADVRPGAWLKLDEQAVLFRALHQDQAGK